ncbi:glycosyltransferase family 39 protein [Nucisporomicrobium flavum]|uniref:glycosyltransferase family 39 protein n=1 Tax=Nucisporomicrobium flavum TaxID=2785915 RepID=UPI0018F2ACFB|nr:glycosyltransferase family 39 protein [Nucisporomicrobium flavum]
MDVLAATEKERADTPPPSGDRWWRLLPGVLPAVLMTVVGVIGAGRPVLSWDEVSTADVARRSPAQIWQLVQHVDAVFGPYYFFMHGWTRLVGTSELDLRLPSIIAMAAAAGLAGELGRRLFSPLVGLLAGLFLCILPNSTRYAAEARPYALTCLLSVLAVLLLLSATERTSRWRWVAYGCAVVLLGVSHLVALTTLAAHALIVVMRHRDGPRRVLAPWAVTLAICAVVLLPVAWLGTRQSDTQLTWVDPLTLGKLYQAPGAIAGAHRTAWLLIGLAVLARWRPARPVAYLTVLALAPPAALAVVSLLFHPFWVGRYLLIVLALTAILAAVAVAGTVTWSSRRGRVLTVLRILAVLLLLAMSAYPDQRRVRSATYKNGPDYRGTAALIERDGQAGDALVYEPRTRALRAGVDYYLRHDSARPRDVLVHRPAAEVGRLPADEYRRDAPARLSGERRVWLIVDGHRDDPLERYPALRGVLGTRFVRVGYWQVDGATVALFRNRTGA